jgi:hypothetical protein
VLLDGLTDALAELDGDTLELGLTLADGLTDGETLLDGETLEDGETEGETLELGETDGLTLLEGLALALGDIEALAELEGLTLALGETPVTRKTTSSTIFAISDTRAPLPCPPRAGSVCAQRLQRPWLCSSCRPNISASRC